MSTQPTAYKRILIIATRQIGDTLITTPLIHRVREIWPTAKIDFLGFQNAIGILDGNPDLNACIGSSQRPSLKEYLSLFKRLFRQYDLAIITQPSDRAYLYGLFAGKNRVGVLHPNQKGNFWKTWITKHQVMIDYFQQHVVTEKLHLLDPFITSDNNLTKSQMEIESGTQVSQVSSEIFVQAPTSQSLPSEFHHLPEKFVVIHPCPLTQYKRWPIDAWVEVIEYLADQNISVLMSGGPSTTDRELSDTVLRRLKTSSRDKVIDGTAKLNFAQLSGILKKALAYVGVDTSVTHLAAACNTPTITLFGATPPTNFGPWPNGFTGSQPFALRALRQTCKNVTILQGPGDCVPCRKAGCEDRADSKSECLEKLPAQQVIDELDRLLKNKSV